MIPNDPVMLLSYVNTKLRDTYKNLEDMCDDLELDRLSLVEKLGGIDYHYDCGQNKFV